MEELQKFLPVAALTILLSIMLGIFKLSRSRPRWVRAVLRRWAARHLPEGYEETMQYGMIGYYVPHRVHPAGYHCDPRQPLPFAALGSQKNHMSLHLMCVYAPGETQDWFHAACAKWGKKLEMGKACVRFRKLDDLPLDVIGELFRRTPAKKT